jgi:hypothetical protein
MPEVFELGLKLADSRSQDGFAKLFLFDSSALLNSLIQPLLKYVL